MHHDGDSTSCTETHLAHIRGSCLAPGASIWVAYPGLAFNGVGHAWVDLSEHVDEAFVEGLANHCTRVICGWEGPSQSRLLPSSIDNVCGRAGTSSALEQNPTYLTSAPGQIKGVPGRSPRQAICCRHLRRPGYLVCPATAGEPAEATPAELPWLSVAAQIRRIDQIYAENPGI